MLAVSLDQNEPLVVSVTEISRNGKDRTKSLKDKGIQVLGELGME